MSMSAISLKDFMALTSVEGGKTFGDTIKEAIEATRKNTEFFNNLVGTPKTITGDNIIFEWDIYTPNVEFDNSDLTAPDPIVSRQVFKMPDKDLSNKYQLDNRGRREALDWGSYISRKNEKINDNISLVNNLQIYKSIVDYCEATGAVRVIEKLTSNTSTKDEKIVDVKNIATVMDVITNSITRYNLGQDSSRVITLLSPKAYREACFAMGVMNGSDRAFDTLKNGDFTEFLGYKFKKVPQFGQAVPTDVAVGYKQKQFDFSDVVGLTFSIDSLAVFMNEPIWNTVPNGLQSYVTSVIWRILAVVRPSSSHLNMLYKVSFPDLTKINAKRAELIDAEVGQPFAYAGANLPGGALNQLTDAEQKNLAKNAKNYDVGNTINLKA